MTEFKVFRNKVKENFEKMCEKRLYLLDIDKDELWNIYQDSWPKGMNEIYLVNREHDCNTCKSFILNIGRCCTINGKKIVTVWDGEFDKDFQPVADAMAAYLRTRHIKDVFISGTPTFGIKENDRLFEDGHVVSFEHFYADVPESAKLRSLFDTIDSKKGEIRTIYQVFKRGVEEITDNAIDDTLDLINDNNLYRGQEFKKQLETFKEIRTEILAESDEDVRELMYWDYTITKPTSVVRIKNTVIGTLLDDLSRGTPIDEAVRVFEAAIAPSNYMRPKAVFTQKMLDEAKQKVIDLGYKDSLARRFATLDDISINDVLFANRDARERIADADPFAELSKDIQKAPKDFSHVQEIAIDDFIKDVLTDAKDVRLYVTPDMKKNFCSLVASKNKDAKSMFKWNNNISWAYTGNMTDLDIKENVSKAGGKVDGVMRFSIQWNDTEIYDEDDKDAHCLEPAGGKEIFFGHRLSQRTGGNLDVDIIHPTEGKPAVENITYPSKEILIDGKYLFFVHIFTWRSGGPFKAELELEDGTVFSYNYTGPLHDSMYIKVAAVEVKNHKFIAVEHFLPATKGFMGSDPKWNIQMNEFAPVSVMCLSPNYWNDKQVGNKHYMFMLEDCVNDTCPNGFFNEYLNSELLEHKRVFEALASKAKCETVDDQLSGVGFSSTIHKKAIVKVITNDKETLYKLVI